MSSFHRGFKCYALLLLATVGCALEVTDADDPGDTGTVAQPIANGETVSSNPIYVAIYHKMDDADPTPPARGYHWCGRPCSGTVIGRRMNKTYVLTARHCATRTGEKYAALVPASDLRVTMATAPGPLLAGAVPPASPVTVTAVDVPTAPASWAASDGREDYDLAVITTTGYLPALYRVGINMAPETALSTGAVLDGSGYGRSVPLLPNGDEQELSGIYTGAGVLRRASQFSVRISSPSYLSITNDAASPVDAWFLNGDSGSSLIWSATWLSGSVAYFWPRVAGVLSTVDVSGVGGRAAGCPVSFHRDWLIQRVGGIYVSPLAETGKNLGTASTPASGVAVGLKAGDSSGTRWSYDSQTMQLRIAATGYTTLCLDGTSSSTLRLATCSSSSAFQKWEVTSTQEIRNVGAAKCLRYAATPTLATCSATDYRHAWAWHVEP
jgi:hypothetical protein